jgi:hypothetical protein
MSDTKPLLVRIREALGMDTKTFTQEWKTLPQEDRDQIKAGVENGTMTY